MGALHPADLAVFAAYFLVFAAVAFRAGRRRKEDAADFFLQRDKLPWYAIGFSMIASGISSEQFIGTVGFAYSHGLSVANWEWGNGPSILVLVFLFIPFYLRHRIVTMPHFLERRFDSRVRTLFAVLSILIRDAPPERDRRLGDRPRRRAEGPRRRPRRGAARPPRPPRERPRHPVDGPPRPDALDERLVCSNQNINQSTLGAKSPWPAQMGVVLAGLLWLVVPLADVFPGLVAHALDPSIRADDAYFFVIERLVPAGLRGLVFAVLCAAVVSAVQAGINGVATIFTFDVYGRIGRKGADEARLIRVGRVFAGTALAVGALWAPMVARFGRIFSYFQEGWAFVAVPVAVTFVAGVLWKRMNANAALVTLSLVFPMLVFAYLLRLGGVGMNAFNVAGLVLAGTILLVLVLGFVTKPTGTEDLSMVWGQARPGTHDAAEAPVHRGVAFWAAVMILAYAAVYAALW